MQATHFTINGETTPIRQLGQSENPWKLRTVAAVGPLGQLVVRHLEETRADVAIGDVPIKTMSGQPILDPIYVKRGWVLYEDLCTGRVPGVEGDLDAWTRWKSLVAYNAAGRPLPAALRDDDRFFHPEVARRRKAGGIEVTPTVEEFKAMFPGYDFDEADEEQEAD